jgi:hypothetical protein
VIASAGPVSSSVASRMVRVRMRILVKPQW